MTSTSIVILQARTNSSRLPGKVLLPIAGLPLVVLAAKRAGNKGRNVIVATSQEASDDGLFEVVHSYGFKCIRGSLENTLQRFIKALEGYSSDTLVFRLTADNVFPDGDLLDEIEDDFIKRNLDYLCCNGHKSGLPYGVSVELMRAGKLREAALLTNDIYDQEHVTPYIRRHYGEAYFEKYKWLEKGDYRCTVDTLSDYIALQQVFSGLQNPVDASTFELINRLNLNKSLTQSALVTKKLVLGTAQLGMKYGIVNEVGKLDKESAKCIINLALNNGVVSIDTAREYGESEKVIGETLKDRRLMDAKVITKLSSLRDCPLNAEPSVVCAFVDSSIYQSCFDLKRQKLDAVLLHRASHLVDWNGKVWQRLLDYKIKGIIKELGVSVQSPEELKLAISFGDVTHIQMPFNVLDWRWDHLISSIMKVKERRQLTIHVRSALLQGLLTTSIREHWKKANFKNEALVIEWLINQTKVTESNSISAFCLRYLKSHDWIDGVVIGVETKEQLIDNLNTFSNTQLTKQQIAEIKKSRPKVESDALNPARWKGGV